MPIGARLFAIADTFDAITSDRPSRAGRSLHVAREEISRFGGTQFDPTIVEAFLQISEADFLRMGARFAQPPRRVERTEWHLSRVRDRGAGSGASSAEIVPLASAPPDEGTA